MLWRDNGWVTDIKIPTLETEGGGINVAGTEVSMRKNIKF